MHMADALLSPAVGGVMWTATAGAVMFSSKKINFVADDMKLPLMGILGAFVFAAQMINFTIPGTGSSGHIGGGLLLAVLLGPYASFLTIASILFVQALFFADGGLLALGSNIFNLGVFPCFIAYPLIYKNIAGSHPERPRLLLAAIIAAVISLQLGSLAVVLQTTLSGIAELPFISFLLLMQPIHLAIGLVEGLVTAAVLGFIWKARPDLVGARSNTTSPSWSGKQILVVLVLSSVLIGGFFSWFASSQPDGLEWSISKTSGGRELENPGNNVHRSLADMQKKTALMPDYALKENPDDPTRPGTWFFDKGQTTAAGIIGGILTLLTVLLIGGLLKKNNQTTTKDTDS